jgi:hypothetical protein
MRDSCLMRAIGRPGCLLLLLALWALPSLTAAEPRTRNIVLITTDGMRWQEVFRGAEESLLNKENGGVRDTNTVRERFWRPAPEARREALFPSLWKLVSQQGQIFGNQDKGSVVKVMNGRNFSYPGYNEFLTGIPDPRIISNARLPNPNTNVFEFLNRRPAFHNRVSAVVNWDVIAWVLNAGRSRIPCWTGLLMPSNAPAIRVPAWVEESFPRMTPIWKDVILDGFTAGVALDHVRTAKPRALYVAFGETDEWAHDGRYDLYLATAHNVDRFIGQLWDLMQSMPEYRGRTSFVITSDHGRGVSPVRWKNHGAEIEESGAVWVAVIGPDTPAKGERTQVTELRQGQVAATIAALVGEDFNRVSSQSAPPIGDVLPSRP